MAEKVYDFVELEMHPKVRHMILMNDRNRRESPRNEKPKRKRRASAEDLNIFGEFLSQKQDRIQDRLRLGLSRT